MHDISRSIGALAQRFRADPVPWAIWLSIRRVLSKIKSAYLGRLFHAPALYLGPGCRVFGSRFIQFGSDIYAQGNLWLHAIAGFNHQHFNPSVTIGNGVSFSERVHITCIERIEIGNGVLIGSGVYIGDHHHGQYSGRHQSHPDTAPILRDLGGGGPVIIGDNVWIGDNAVIIGPVSIGPGAIIGANSVVRRDVPAWTIAVGAPALPIKRFNHPTGQWERVWADDSNDAPARLDRELKGEHT